jgi:hypothetical protein
MPFRCRIASGALITATAVLPLWLAQAAPQTVPADPLELATGSITTAQTAEARTNLIGLLERARQNNNLHVAGGAPFDLRVSFTASGGASYSGPGTLEEEWVSASQWRWVEQLAGFNQTRIVNGGWAFDSPPQAYQPLRLHMLRQAIFWPVAGNLSTAFLRSAPATWQGMALTCVLLSYSANAAGTVGRQWQEMEYCIEPKTGLLQTLSVVPGLYTTYDYAGAWQFNHATLPRRFSMVQNGAPVLQASIDNLVPLTNTDAATFTPSDQMKAPGPVIQQPTRYSVTIPSPTGQAEEPAVIHLAVDAEGHLLEAELLEAANSTLASAAVDFVKGYTFEPAYRGRVPLQREIFFRLHYSAPAPPQVSHTAN